MEKRTKTRYISLVATASIFLGAFSTIIASTKINKANAFDFSSDENSTTINPSDVIEKVIGSQICDAEKTYVNTLDEYKLTYQNNPNANNIQVVDYKNNLYVHANSYTFKDSSNRTLTWVPSSATYKSETIPFVKDNNEYVSNITTFDGVDQNVKVNYELALNLDKNSVNTLINSAYNYGKNAYSKLSKNEDALDKYKADLRAYEKYEKELEKYNQDKALYEQYLMDKNEYDIKYEEYQNYLKNYAKYLTDLEKYVQYLDDLDAYNNQVLAYNQYVKDLEYYNANYEANKEKYNAYKDAKVKIEYRLATMQIAFTAMTDMERTIYSAVMGDSVTSVLSRKSDIVSVGGVPADAVDRAGLATTELRKVFTDYVALTEDADRYAYYKENWSHIRDNANELARCLTKFIFNDTVCNLLNAKGPEYLRKYYILVAQLIYWSDALNVSPVYNYEGWNTKTKTGSLSPTGAAYLDENFLIRISTKEKQTYKQILDGEEFLDTSLNYGRPGTEVYDQELIDLMTEPEKVEKPSAPPAEVKEPVAPKIVQNPGDAPAVVLNPGEPPKTVSKPAYPTLIELTEMENLMANAYHLDELQNREIYTSDVTIKVYQEVTKDFTNDLQHIVKFYDTKGNLITTSAPFTSGVEFDAQIPTYDYEQTYDSFSFVWVDENDQEVMLTNVNKSGDIFAKLVPGSKTPYTVTWNIDGDILSSSYFYGETPKAPQNPVKLDENGCYYEFKGWDKLVTPVTENVTYTAVFAEHHYTYVSVTIEGVTTDYVYKEGEFSGRLDTPTKPDTETSYFVFLRWNQSKPDAYHYQFTAVFTEYKYFFVTWVVDGEVILENQKYKKGQKVTYPYATPTKPGDATYESYILDYWADSNGNQVTLKNITSTITLYAHFVGCNDELFTIYWYVDDEIIFSETVGSGVMPTEPEATKANDDTYYYLFTGWDQEVVPADSSASYHAIFEAHLLVHVTVTIGNNTTNYALKSIDDLVLPENPTKPSTNENSYNFKEWNKVKIDENHWQITAIFETTFVITFVYEGVFEEVTFVVGGIIAKADPTKSGNETYYFEFIGWTNSDGTMINIGDVTTNMILYAKFEQKFVEYHITFVVGDEKIEQIYHYGDAIVAPENPTKQSDDLHYYIFQNWDKEIPSIVTKDATFTGVFEEKSFVIVKVIIDEFEETLKFKQDENIDVPNAEKASDERHDYIFVEWKITPTENGFIYTAKFNVLTYYFVTWDVEGVKTTEKYLEGSKISYKHDTPTKDEEEKVYYVFSGWSVDLAVFTISNDITVSAKFELRNKIVITWNANGVTYVEYYKPEENIALPALDVKNYADNLYYYVFNKWEITLPEKASEDRTINAKYDKTALVGQEDGSALYIKDNNGTYLVEVINSKIDGYFDYLKLNGLFSWMAYDGNYKAVEIRAQKVNVFISEAKVRLLISKGIFGLKFEMHISKTNRYEFMLSALNEEGGSIQISGVTLEVKLSGIFNSTGSFLYLNDEKQEATFDGSLATISGLELNEYYKIITTYKITYEKSPNYEIELSKDSAEFGEQVTVKVTPAVGYEIIKIVAKSGASEIQLSDGSFMMPDGDVVLEISVIQIEYTIEFYVDGVCVFSMTGHYGDIVLDPGLKNPEIFDKESDENYRYVFKGWDHEITNITGDAVYTAVFEAIPLEGNQVTQKFGILNTLLIILGVSLVIGGGVVAIIIIKKRHK